MAKFVFHLEAVLTQRRAIERERTLAVAALERERLAIEARLRALQQGISREREDLRERLGFLAGGGGTLATSPSAGSTRVVDVRGVRMQATAAVRLDAIARQLALQLAGVFTRLDKARAELARAMGERKAVEKLRDARLEEWRSEQARREGAALDELATMRAARRDDEWDLGDGRGAAHQDRTPSPESEDA
jgi:flagellar biosynthesis chaperone FliJ